LKEQEFSKRDRELVLGRVFDMASTRQLETVTGWKKSRVAQKLKSPKIKQAITDLRHGNISHTGKAQSPKSLASLPTEQNPFGPYGQGLHVWKRWAQDQIADAENSKHTKRWAASLADTLKSERNPKEAHPMVLAIRRCPAMLLTDEGRTIL
jgi:hypothetical protein